LTLADRVREYIDNLWEPGVQGINKLTFARQYLKERGLSEDYILAYHLGYVPSGPYAHSISIPYYTGTGQLRAIRFRRLDPESTRKYDAPPGEKGHLFNVGSVRHHTVYLTEGEFDAIVLEQMGYPAVGVPGANNFKEEWKWLFLGNQVRIVMDADEAGQKAGLKLARILGPIAEDVERVQLPEGHDVSSLYVESEEALRECIRAFDS